MSALSFYVVISILLIDDTDQVFSGL